MDGSEQKLLGGRGMMDVTATGVGLCACACGEVR